MNKADIVASERMLERKLTFSGKPFSNVNHFVNSDGNYIYCRYWKPEKPPTALVFIVHGYSGHSGRHNMIAQAFVDLGLLVFSHDHICHGESEGRRLDIKNYKIMLQDLVQHYTLLKEAYPQLPIFLYGYSMGGALAILLAHQNPDFFKAVILSSPMITKHRKMSSTKVLLGRAFMNVFPRLSVDVCHTRQENRDDPLVYYGSTTLRTGYQLYSIIRAVKKILPSVDFSFLALHGNDDRACDVSGSKALHRLAKSKDKALKTFDGGFHDLARNPGNIPDQFCSNIKDWLVRFL